MPRNRGIFLKSHFIPVRFAHFPLSRLARTLEKEWNGWPHRKQCAAPFIEKCEQLNSKMWRYFRRNIKWLFWNLNWCSDPPPPLSSILPHLAVVVADPFRLHAQLNDELQMEKTNYFRFRIKPNAPFNFSRYKSGFMTRAGIVGDRCNWAEQDWTGENMVEAVRGTACVCACSYGTRVRDGCRMARIWSICH